MLSWKQIKQKRIQMSGNKYLAFGKAEYCIHKGSDPTVTWTETLTSVYRIILQNLNVLIILGQYMKQVIFASKFQA